MREGEFISERDRNCGLANSAIIGATDIVNMYGKVITMEDVIEEQKWIRDRVKGRL